MATFELADAMLGFAAGTESNWNNFAMAIPNNVVIYSTDLKKFKRGDGVHRYSELPDGPSIEGIITGETNIVNLLTKLVVTDEDCIIYINNEIYAASSTKLSDLLVRLQAIANKDTIQDANMDAIASQFGMLNIGITNADDGKLVIVDNHQMKPGILPEDIITIELPSPIHILSFELYKDKACTEKCSSFYYDSVYYAKVNAAHDTADVDELSFYLTDDNQYVTVDNLGRGLFRVNVGNVVLTGNVTLNAIVSYNADSVNVAKVVPISTYTGLIGLYGGNADDEFRLGMAKDTNNNIFVIGVTKSEGLGGTLYGDGLIVKFDSNLNILAKKCYGDSRDNYFHNVAIDPAGNVYVVGFTESTTASVYDALIIKFDNNLNLLLQKTYGGAVGTEKFVDVKIDSNGNIFAGGFTSSEGSGNYDVLIIKFDSNLNILVKKRYGGTNSDYGLNIALDSNNNIFVVGSTLSAGLGGTIYGDALIIKFDNNLNVLARKVYGGTGDDHHLGVKVDSQNNVYAIGYTTITSGIFSGQRRALIIKYDNNLNKLIAKEMYHPSKVDVITEFFGITLDSDYIYITGYIKDVSSHYNALIVKFDSNLNIIKQSIFGNPSLGTTFLGSSLIIGQDLVMAGATKCINGSSNCLILKMVKNIPTGSYCGNGIFGNLILQDNDYAITDSNQTFSDGTFTLADSNLTSASISLTLADSNLTYNRELF
jgi:hypothetical protein